MSYCVHCGVELAASEKACPLCHTEVCDPKEPRREENAPRPWPPRLEPMPGPSDRRYFARLAGLLLLIPACVTAIGDLLEGGTISWSAYVMGAMGLLFVWVALPFFFVRRHAVLFFAADCAVAILYLALIGHISGGGWFMPIGLPIALGTGILAGLLTWYYTRKPRPPLLVCFSLALFAAGLLVVWVELVLKHAAGGSLSLTWSPYALSPCVVLGFAALMAERRRNWKESLRRRMFY